MQRFIQHFGGKRNAGMERTKFRATVTAAGEMIQQFAVRLKHSSRHCDFGGASLDQLLVDYRLVAIIRADGETIQQFAVRLKHSSCHCQFGGASLDQLLVDQLVAGIRCKCATNKPSPAVDLRCSFRVHLPVERFHL